MAITSSRGLLRYWVLVLAFILSAYARKIKDGDNDFVCSVGGVVDCSTRVGREQKIAMEIAVQDFHNLTAHELDLHIQDLSGNAALAAINLIKTQQVQAIVGTLTWQDSVLVAEMDDVTKEVPIFSLSAPTMPMISEKAPSVISMVHDFSVEISCIAAIIGSFRWQKVIAIYEDRNSYTSDLGIITLLSTSLKNIDVELEHYSAFPAMSTLLDPKVTVQEELKLLRGKQSRVFIVLQSSLPLIELLFQQAKQMGMMEKSYAWITADGITSLLDSVSSSVIAPMAGVLGFKTYFPYTTASVKEFAFKFKRKFQAEYPTEENHYPSAFALRAYDAIWATAVAAENSKSDSRTLFQKILSSNFEGLSGKMHFQNYRLSHLTTFQIVNVFGKSYRELGFWSTGFGFSENLEKHDNTSNEAVLGPVFWPGGITSVPSGLMERPLPEDIAIPLKVGVMATSTFTEFVEVSQDENQNTTYITGISIEVFEAAVRYLGNSFMYKLVPFYGPFDDLVNEVTLKTFDVVIGDVMITADKFQLIEFSQPYIESELVMVVLKESEKRHDPFMFMKPFTKGMWLLMAAMTLFTGFVVWVMEHRKNYEFGGSSLRQVVTTFWFSFSTVVFAHKESLTNNSSRIVLIPWLLLILIVTSAFTANLTSMLNTPLPKLSVIDVSMLKNTNAIVGCDGKSFTIRYLSNVLGLKRENIKTIASIDDYAEALYTGHVRVAFFLKPHARVFLAKYCEDFTTTGPTYKLPGFGFVFPKGSPLALDISRAIVYLKETGRMQQLEDEKFSISDCLRLSSNDNGIPSLGPEPFAGLFYISGSVSAIALFIKLIQLLRERWNGLTNIHSTLMGGGLWTLLTTFFNQNQIENPVIFH